MRRGPLWVGGVAVAVKASMDSAGEQRTGGIGVSTMGLLWHVGAGMAPYGEGRLACPGGFTLAVAGRVRFAWACHVLVLPECRDEQRHALARQALNDVSNAEERAGPVLL